MKINIENVAQMAVHHIGSKVKGDGVVFGDNLIPVDNLQQDIRKLISKSFDVNDLYHFCFEPTVELNPVFTFVRAIFHDRKSFLQQSKYIAKILYESSVHPNIKDGELSLFYLEGCELNGELYDAIAIIKSESQQQLLQVSWTGQKVMAQKASGISLSKAEKGCLVFAKDEESGYQMAVVDNTKKGGDSKYWKDNFLHIKSNNGAKHQTKRLMEVCNEFVNNVVADTDRLTKVEKALVSVRARKVLEGYDILPIDNFVEEVFPDFLLRAKFKEYLAENEAEGQFLQDGSINIDKTAIKHKKAKVEIIKLDGNFDLRILGGQDRIIKGYDKDAGMNYYQLYFEEEK